MDNREAQIIEFIKSNPGVSSTEISEGITATISLATVKRLLSVMTEDRYLIKRGQGRATKYFISPAWELMHPVNLNVYFQNEIDAREIKEHFNFNLIQGALTECTLFSKSELEKLDRLQGKFKQNIDRLSETEYKKELERLAIDLSWKSSQIEGNTYSLLETERLLKEKETASGRTREEAVMLLNHKEAIDFIIGNPDFLIPLSVSGIEDLHSMLIRELGVGRNIRKGRVGITGTNYRPLDNEFQILEALSSMCDLVNKKVNVFEKALLVLVLISYIQPFTDGNKRTARIVSNAVLMNFQYCPISFRTVDSGEYKKANLLFYEQNNISGIKEVFINQFEFAVNTYF